MLLLSRAFSQLALAAALALGLAAPARAQAPLDPTGHWEGAIDAQGNELRFELDVIRGDTGHLVGTLNVPSAAESRRRRSDHQLPCPSGSAFWWIVVYRRPVDHR